MEMVLESTGINTDPAKKEESQINFEKENIAIEAIDLDFFYNPEAHALKNVQLEIPTKQVTAFIGPSGCGKSTLLRCFNRMNDVIAGVYLTGKVLVNGENIYREGMRLETLRKQVGMVFQKSNPFPMSIYENVAFGPKVNGITSSHEIEELVFSALKQADLWKEVKDRLKKSALDLSGGQQQRICIARALANKPDIILMDEPASALDPISTGKIEETINELKSNYTIVIVTHNMQQAARVSDFTAFMMIGELIEFNKTDIIFTNPNKKLTEEYITGRFG
jgi:phosphate transport system ATP-binding protein